MENIIEELYLGNVNPREKSYKGNVQYTKAIKIVAENEELLTKMLEGKEKTLFLNYTNAWSDLLGVTSTENFIDGFRLGAKFTLDTFFQSQNEI